MRYVITILLFVAALGGARPSAQSQDVKALLATIKAADHDLLVHDGRHERELRPPLQVDKGTVVLSLAAELAGRLDNAAAFGDDIGDLPAFEALTGLTRPDGMSLYVVRVAAVDTESPQQVADAADVSVAGATGAVALLAALRDAARAASSAQP